MRRLTDDLITSPLQLLLLGDLVREDVRFHIAITMAGENDMIKNEIVRLHFINREVSRPVVSASKESPMEFHLREMIGCSLLAVAGTKSGFLPRELTL